MCSLCFSLYSIFFVLSKAFLNMDRALCYYSLTVTVLLYLPLMCPVRWKLPHTYSQVKASI